MGEVLVAPLLALQAADQLDARVHRPGVQRVRVESDEVRVQALDLFPRQRGVEVRDHQVPGVVVSVLFHALLCLKVRLLEVGEALAERGLLFVEESIEREG